MGLSGLYEWLRRVGELAESTPEKVPSSASDEEGGASDRLDVGDFGPTLPLWPRMKPEEFDYVFARQFDHVFRFLEGLTGDYDTAQDLAQDTFYYALKHREFLPPCRMEERRWLFHIVRRRVLPRHWRGGRRLSEEEHLRRQEADQAPADPLGGLVREQTLQRVRQVIDGFEPDRRYVFVLTQYMEYSVAEVVRTLGIKESTVRSHLRRGRRQLAAALLDDPSLSEDERRALDAAARGEPEKILTPDFRPQPSGPDEEAADEARTEPIRTGEAPTGEDRGGEQPNDEPAE